MIYCIQAHEDKVSARCAFELGYIDECANLGGYPERRSNRMQSWEAPLSDFPCKSRTIPRPD